MMTAISPSDEPVLLDDFNRYFDISLAITRKQRAQVYKIRYRVYCEEFDYEPGVEQINHQEVDEFDCQSVHCLVTHRASGNAAGCVRVVMVENNDLMPLEKHAADSLDPGVMERFSNQRGSLCEISRLAVDGAFRRRRREWKSRFGDLESVNFSAGEQRTFPLIALFLVLGAGAVADILARKNCFAIMEPFLPAMLSRAGLKFQRIGADFEYRGVRAPYFANLDDLNNAAPDDLRRRFNAVRQDFARVLAPEANAAGFFRVPDNRPGSAGLGLGAVLGVSDWMVKSLVLGSCAIGRDYYRNRVSSEPGK